MSNLNEYDKEIRRLYLEEKMSDEEVAQALPVPATARGISSYRHRYGIKGHRRGPKSSLQKHQEEITKLYVEDGLTDALIAEKFNVTAEAVRNARIKWRIATTRHKKAGRYSMGAKFEEIRDELPAAWERSKRWHARQQRMVGSSARVAKEFGVGPSTAQKWLASLGLVESRSVHGETAPQEALSLFDTGLSVPAVAREMGCPEETVRAWISKERDLSNPDSRRSYEEKIAFRRAVSIGKAQSVAGSGRFNYNGTRLDSSHEVRFAKSCDRLEMNWETWNRAKMGVCEVSLNGEVVRYAPDFLVEGIPIEVKGIYDATAATKIATWRQSKGSLAMVMKDELFEFESAATFDEAVAILRACCYLDPPQDKAFWE